MFLLASRPIGTRFSESILGWYLYRVEIARAPESVEWTDSENFWFIGVHVCIGVLTASALLWFGRAHWRALTTYVARKMTQLTWVQRCPIAVGLLVAAAAIHVQLWNRGLQLELNMNLASNFVLMVRQSILAMSLVIPAALASAALLVLAKGRKLRAPPGRE